MSETEKTGGIEQITTATPEGEAYLRKISKPIDFNNSEDLEVMKETAERLTEFCKDAPCFAMASVQIPPAAGSKAQAHEPVRMVYLKHTVETTDGAADEHKILVNPVVTSRKGKTQYWEACMSCPGDFALVERPYELTLAYQDICGGGAYRNN